MSKKVSRAKRKERTHKERRQHVASPASARPVERAVAVAPQRESSPPVTSHVRQEAKPTSLAAKPAATKAARKAAKVAVAAQSTVAPKAGGMKWRPRTAVLFGFGGLALVAGLFVYLQASPSSTKDDLVVVQQPEATFPIAPTPPGPAATAETAAAAPPVPAATEVATAVPAPEASSAPSAEASTAPVAPKPTAEPIKPAPEPTAAPAPAPKPTAPVVTAPAAAPAAPPAPVATAPAPKPAPKPAPPAGDDVYD